MSLTSQQRRELLDLLHAQRERVLSADARTRLTALLTNDDEAVALYLEHALLVARLRWALGGVASNAAQGPSPPPATEPPAPISSAGTRVVSTRTWFAIAASLMLVGYFGGLIGLLAWDRLTRTIRVEMAQSAKDPVATVLASKDVQWAADQPELRNPQSGISSGEPLAIESGLVELQLKQGANLLIEGPAQWKIDGGNSATLTRGKLVAQVPQQAIGFTLETPTARIVDLGTEFGVIVASDGRSSLDVRQGIVEVKAASDSSSTGAVRLMAGQAVKIDNEQGIERIPAETVRFEIRRGSGPRSLEAGSIKLANPSFEAPSVVPPLEVKRPDGWYVKCDGGPTEVGLQVGAAGQFLYWNEPNGSLGQFSIPGYRISAAGITYRLKFRVAVSNAGRCAVTARLLLNERMDDKRTRTLELSETPWREEELAYTTTAADVGKSVGIVFEFATLAPGAQVLLDDVSLKTQSETPEAIK